MVTWLTVLGVVIVIALAWVARWAQRKHEQGLRALDPPAQVFDFQMAKDLRDQRRARGLRKASAYRETL